jgi:hypothetical protein
MLCGIVFGSTRPPLDSGSAVASGAFVAAACGVAPPAAGWWQVVQLSTVKLACESGDGLILPAPWQVVQSWYAASVMLCGITFGVTNPPLDSGSVVASASGVAPPAAGWWQVVQLSTVKLAWLSGAGLSLPAPWQAVQSW